MADPVDHVSFSGTVYQTVQDMQFPIVHKPQPLVGRSEYEYGVLKFSLFKSICKFHSDQGIDWDLEPSNWQLDGSTF